HTRFSRDWSSDVCSSDLLKNSLRSSCLLVEYKLIALATISYDFSYFLSAGNPTSTQKSSMPSFLLGSWLSRSKRRMMKRSSFLDSQNSGTRKPLSSAMRMHTYSLTARPGYSPRPVLIMSDGDNSVPLYEC